MCGGDCQKTIGHITTTSFDHHDNSNDIIDAIIIQFRPIHINDRIPIQTLHEEWFPVRYQDEFYNELVHSRFHNSNEPLFTIIAESIPSSCSSSHPNVTSYYNDNNNNDNITNTNNGPCINGSFDESTRTITTRTIAACLVGSFLNYDQVSNTTRQLLIPNYEQYTTLFYIMTLGTQELYRHYGIGTILINKCLYYASQNNKCGCIYLHVITSNIPAIKFYEKLGFVRIIEIDNYYTIDQQHYNCYLYAKLLNGT
jgi:histone acetyltransferase MCC1